jgi:hypothetical protein
MANFNQSPSGQTSVSLPLASITLTAASPATGYTLGPQPRPIRYLEPPDGQLYPQTIPVE